MAVLEAGGASRLKAWAGLVQDELLNSPPLAVGRRWMLASILEALLCVLARWQVVIILLLFSLLALDFFPPSLMFFQVKAFMNSLSIGIPLKQISFPVESNHLFLVRNYQLSHDAMGWFKRSSSKINHCDMVLSQPSFLLWRACYHTVWTTKLSSAITSSFPPLFIYCLCIVEFAILLWLSIIIQYQYVPDIVRAKKG